MSKYKLIHKISNISIFMLFVINGYFIFSYKSMKIFSYKMIFIVLNIIEIMIFISFFIIGNCCENGTRKKHAMVKTYISIFIYILTFIFMILSLKL